MTTRLVVVDDQEVVRAGFAALLSTQDDLEVVGVAEDGARAVAVCAAARPDVVLMDVRMPVLDGISATRALLGAPDPPKVLMLTTFDLDEHVYDALAAGASGFLLKDVTAERLFDAVRVVAGGEALLAPSVTRRLIGEFARLRPRPPSPALAELTPRETEVLRLLAAGLSNVEIADLLPRPADVAALKQVADGYGVSVAAMAYRGKDLGLYGDSAVRRVLATLTRLGWRTDEPVRADYPGEEPELLPRAVELAAAHGLPLPRLAANLQIGLPRLRTLIGLPDRRPRLRLVPTSADPGNDQT